MMNIAPTNNYNTNFKGMDYGKIYKEMERISLKQEEKILVKEDANIKIMKKNSTIIKKLYNELLDTLFSLNLMRPIVKKYDERGNLRLKVYSHNAYKKYDYNNGEDSFFDDCFASELRFPSGMHKYYEHSLAYGPWLKKEIFPDGTTRYYERASGCAKSHLVTEVLPDKTERIFKNGHLIIIIGADGNIIKSNLYT